MNWVKIAAWPRRYLYQAPRGWFYRMALPSDQRLRDMIAGKSVAVVGNAQSLFGAGFGPEIDAHDVIIRMNKGIVNDPASQGTRTDIVTLTPELTEAETRTAFHPKLYVFLIHRLRHFRYSDAQTLDTMVMYALRYWMADQRMIGRRPSSGFMMISYLLRLNCAAQITLYGFDFGNSATFYNPVGYKTPHNFSKEGEIIQRWIAEGRLTLRRPD